MLLSEIMCGLDAMQNWGGGSGIPDNCIVGEGTVTTRRFEEPACIIAGCPGRIIRRDVLWARDDQRNDLQTYEECKDKKALDFLSREQWENFNAWRE
ncbi:polysialic acid O-acetyltransferase [Lachnospiraceae bacterium]|nr:polysialic acid O-acetyltransferase [Lachnospiraceae bacterium]